MKRRDFFKAASAGAVAATMHPSLTAHASPEEERQELHPDYQSNNPGTEYFFLGNGLIQAAVQISPSTETGTHCGLLVMSPEHFGRKISSFLYHPERGLLNSRFFPSVDGKGYEPAPGSASVRWAYPDAIPTIVIEYPAGPCQVREELFCPINDSVIVRTVLLRNTGASAVQASGALLLYPNLMFFDEYDVDRERMTLTTQGYQRMDLFALPASTVGDRHLGVDFGTVTPGAEMKAVFVLTLNHSRDAVESKGIERMREETATYWRGRATIRTGHEGLDHLVATSMTGIRAGVARSGKMDGSIWQYNLEWVRDQSMVAGASAMCGNHDIAEALIRRILTRSVDDSGRTVDASRHRPPETIELDQNGELLYAIWNHWVWTGNDTIIREFWPKISAVADYVLQPIFRDPAIGLLKNTREYWEREAFFGVREGYELAYQHWNIVGLQMASDMAALMKEPQSRKRWTDASSLMKQSFLSHPKYALVADGRFIKRRLVNGEVQRVFTPPDRNRMPPGMPLRVEPVSYCDPDASIVLPIAFGLVDPTGPLATKTLAAIEHLWNQRWDFGGYARYDVTSEPDSPGPWPFATLFITRAYLEAGNHEKVWRALNWLINVQGGKAGAWLEYFGPRPTPPLPPVGIVVWTWAEIQYFFFHHLLGVRPNATNLVIRPRLLHGLESVEARVPVRKGALQLTVRKTEKEAQASVSGKRVPLTQGSITIPFPENDVSVDIALPSP
jgi:hypothetical protein